MNWSKVGLGNQDPLAMAIARKQALARPEHGFPLEFRHSGPHTEATRAKMRASQRMRRRREGSARADRKRVGLWFWGDDP